MRIRSTDFSSESTLTKDTVPVNVDAICFWMGCGTLRRAILEVEDFYLAIILSAQTRYSTSSTNQLSELLTHRERLGKRLRDPPTRRPIPGDYGPVGGDPRYHFAQRHRRRDVQGGPGPSANVMLASS